MRDLVVIIVIIGLVFGGDVFIEKYLEKSSEKLIQQIEMMSTSFNEDGTAKKRNVDSLKQIWEETEKPWIVIEYHEEINNIEDLVIETYSYYMSGEKEEFDIAHRKILRLIEDLKNRIDLSLENVL
jgi:hypothetical protein